MSHENESDLLARRLAFYGVLCGAVIALGTVFVSIGGALVFSVIPELYNTIQAEKKLTQLNQTNISEFDDRFKLITWEANSSSFFIYGGLILIVLGIGNAYVFMIYRRPRHTHTQILSHSHNVSDMHDSVNEIHYTGNRYFATRKRLSYHPIDKMFPNVTSESNPVQKQEPKKQRGTLPKGF